MHICHAKWVVLEIIWFFYGYNRQFNYIWIYPIPSFGEFNSMRFCFLCNSLVHWPSCSVLPFNPHARMKTKHPSWIFSYKQFFSIFHSKLSLSSSATFFIINNIFLIFIYIFIVFWILLIFFFLLLIFIPIASETNVLISNPCWWAFSQYNTGTHQHIPKVSIKVLFTFEINVISLGSTALPISPRIGPFEAISSSSSRVRPQLFTSTIPFSLNYVNNPVKSVKWNL